MTTVIEADLPHLAEPTEAPQRLPERAAGALARALALCAVVVPLKVALLHGRLVNATAIAVTTLVVATIVFVLERRDRPGQVLLRAMLGGALGAALAPVLHVWAREGGRLDEAYTALVDFLRHDADQVLAPSIATVLASPAWVLLLLVRARTERLAPQALAGALTVTVIAGGALVIDSSLGWMMLTSRAGHLVRPEIIAAWALLTFGGGALAALAVAFVDRRLASTVDARAPRVAPGRVRRAIAGWALVLTLPLGAAITAQTDRPAHGSIASLRRVLALEAAGTAWEGGEVGLDYVLGGLAYEQSVRHRAIRIARGPAGRWCVTIEPNPAHPRSYETQRLWMDDTGAVHVTEATDPPAVLDPEGGPPAGWWSYGRVTPWR